ncbi:MAG: hypothetical protein N0C81_00635 [Candidatus Thiodiazotropha lotti]|nr:hypothetical protein [Candidatus Thiodiazotropha lotti]ODC00520.1 hypothetical protein A3197_09335 [Candidatus Thiodiazotropha endoloripes]MCG7928655.1 hypothetical protein [Candidatus Thiodiazotropha lotti]MCG8005580.1 hypothetical protein [Candidatus Thiodiazotropha lotti]MCG8006145.1 hypothetical protein [Candidatus Thiodiazotropha lotti]
MDIPKTTSPSTSRWQPSAPLWQRAPNKQADGAPLADLMMLIPRLKHYSEVQINHLQRMLEEVLKEFDEKIVFTDINLKLNVIWVTVLPEPGLCREVALAIRKRVPEAVMVGNQLKSTTTELQAGGWRNWAMLIKRAVLKRSVKTLPQEPKR